VTWNALQTHGRYITNAGVIILSEAHKPLRGVVLVIGGLRILGAKVEHGGFSVPKTTDSDLSGETHRRICSGAALAHGTIHNVIIVGVTPTESGDDNRCSKPNLTPTDAKQMVRSMRVRWRFSTREPTEGRRHRECPPINQTRTKLMGGTWLTLGSYERSPSLPGPAGCPEPQCPRWCWTNSFRVDTTCTLPLTLLRGRDI